MAFMAAAGKIDPMPGAAIFADTMAEPTEVYEWLRWLETKLPFPVHRVSGGDLASDTLKERTAKSGGSYIRNTIPAYTMDDKGNRGMLLRKCTTDYKLVPIRRMAKELMKSAGRKSVCQWIGISVDEAHRMKPSGVKYVTNRYPLIERSMSRHGCLAWMEQNGFPIPPRSACVFCPYHSDKHWLRLKRSDPKAFAYAAEFERKWQEAVSADHGPSKLRGRLFLHRSMVPLSDAEFVNEDQIDLFGNECEGMCGV